MGVPSVAISLDTHREADFSFAARFARKICRFMMEYPFPKNLSLNVNIPALPEDRIRGVTVVKQGKARLIESFEKRVDPRDNTYYWLAGETQPAPSEDADSDITALRKGWITITPIHSDLTRMDVFGDLRDLVEKDLNGSGEPGRGSSG
jgi:5'-nucleotidase